MNYKIHYNRWYYINLCGIYYSKKNNKKLLDKKTHIVLDHNIHI